MPPARFELTTCGLGNRRSILLSYGGDGGFPRFLAFPGQSRTPETRDKPRFRVAQRGAHSVPAMMAPSLYARRVLHLRYHQAPEVEFQASGTKRAQRLMRAGRSSGARFRPIDRPSVAEAFYASAGRKRRYYSRLGPIFLGVRGREVTSVPPRFSAIFEVTSGVI